MEERLKSYKQTQEEPFNKVALDKYINFRNSVTMAIKSAKKEFYKSEFENCKFNQNEKWNFINRMLHRDSNANTPPQYIESQGTKITSIQEISEAFNTHFASVGKA